MAKKDKELKKQKDRKEEARQRKHYRRTPKPPEERRTNIILTILAIAIAASLALSVLAPAFTGNQVNVQVSTPTFVPVATVDPSIEVESTEAVEPEDVPGPETIDETPVTDGEVEPTPADDGGATDSEPTPEGDS